MRSISRFFLLPLALSATVQAADIELKTDKQKVSYLMGYQIGGQLSQQGGDIDIATLTAAIEESLGGGEMRLSMEEAKEVMMRFQQERIAQQQVQGKENAEKGRAFLEANKEKPGVTVLENGLQYKVLKPGQPEGKKPAATDSVTVHYRGTLIDGKEFDSSFSRNEPTTFPLNQVIPGWTQILQLMQEGAKWQVFIPSDLAYGPRGPGVIGPNATLIFEIELIKVN